MLREQLLVLTSAQNITFCGKTMPLPKGAALGVIVNKEDWENPDYQGVYGEAVFVREKERQVVFPRNDTVIDYTVFKDSASTRVIAEIDGLEVRWIKHPELVETT